eukprot:TRINITY_DN1672_c0_g1_i1.p1 TRINITY_DN1672_c0_g1~~TRINITY_DN1672_c0_g1_i1.p1  ORF type:complete len:579 (+),score=71.24 TRINITY_DN1672_c0_g1_i1:68-1804(+)
MADSNNESINGPDDSTPSRTPALNQSVVKTPLSHSIMPKVLSKPVAKPSLDPEPDTIEIEYVDIDPDSDVDEKYPNTISKETYAVDERAHPSKKQAEELWRAIKEMGAPAYESHKSRGSENVKESSQTECYTRPKSGRLIRRPYEDSSVVQMNFQDRLGHYINKKKENTISVAMEMLADEQAHCTFTPRVNTYSRRNLQEFLKDQERFLEKKTAKISNFQISLHEKELSVMQRSPQIDPRSVFLCSIKPRPKSVHKSHAKLEVVKEKGSIRKSRNRSKATSKSFEAGHRATKSIKKLREESQLLQQKKEEELVKSQRKSKEAILVQSKIGRELDQICEKHNPQNAPITFLPFCKLFLINSQTIIGDIMKEFGMLKDIKEEILAKELYDTINGKCKNGINEDLLKSAVLAILRIEAKGDKKLLALELHKRFSVFYFNKMSYQKPAENPQQYSHAPTLNPNSIRLAEKSKERRKQLAQEVSLTNTSNPTLTDLLMIVKKAQEKQTEAKRKKKAAEETKGCTFRPATFAKGLKSKKEDKHIWLRNLSRPSKKSLDKTTEQIEYEKSKDELTFTPRVPRYVF